MVTVLRCDFELFIAIIQTNNNNSDRNSDETLVIPFVLVLRPTTLFKSDSLRIFFIFLNSKLLHIIFIDRYRLNCEIRYKQSFTRPIYPTLQ